MISNIGIDIEEVSRFKRIDKKLLEKFLTKDEIKNLKNKNAEHIAGLFCAKEAVIKACNPTEEIDFTKIQILHNKDSSPYALLKSKKIKGKDLKISISHSKNYAVAAAIRGEQLE